MTRDGVIHHAAFGVRRVLRQIQQIIKLEFRRGPRSLEGLDIVAKPSFVSEFQDVCTANVGQYVPPVIVVLDEIALGKALPIEAAEAVQIGKSRHPHRWDGEIASLMLHTFDPVLGEDGFVQCGGTECVRVIHLESTFPVLVGGRELRDRRRSAEAEICAEEAAVNSIVFEIFVDADEVLVAVAEIAGIENTSINHGGGTRQVISRRCSTSAREDVIGCLRHGSAAQSRGSISIQNLGAECVGKVLLRKGGEGRIWGVDCCSSGSGR